MVVAQPGVHPDAPGHLSPGLRDQGGVGPHAHADHQQVKGNLLPAFQDGGVPFKGIHPVPQEEGHAVILDVALDHGRGLAVQDAGQDVVGQVRYSEASHPARRCPRRI